MTSFLDYEGLKEYDNNNKNYINEKIPTLVAGDNITLSTDADSNEITISSTGGGSGTVGSLTDLGVTATADELNYVDGVTSNIQTQLNGKANSSHGHSDKLPVSTTTATYTTLADFWTHCDSVFKSTNSRIMMGRAKLTTFTPLDGWFRYIVSAQNTLGNGEWAITGSIILDNGTSVYYGIVSGETIIGANIFRDLFAGIRDIVGGRSNSYEKVLREAKDSALREMEQQAAQLGANAVIGVDLDYETVGQSGSMLMVTASGTAVFVQD